MPTHFFFDLDNTLTRSKMPIAPEHVPIFKALTERADVVVVSGHAADKIREDLTETLAGTYFILGQNGNDARLRDGSVLWEHTLSAGERAAAIAFILKAREHLALPVKDENDIIDDRGGEIAYSLIGHHEDQLKKEAFDPDDTIRLRLLADLKNDVEELARQGVEVRAGGTTVLDFFKRGENKGYNVRALIGAMRWEPGECLYVGDALFPGGNDETVVGVIATHGVKDYRETYDYIADLLGMARS